MRDILVGQRPPAGICQFVRIGLLSLVLSSGLGAAQGQAQLDAVFSNFAQANRVCLGNGLGSFTCSDVSPDTNDSGDVALGLVNGDAFLDAVFSNSLNQANRVCLGNGLGGFTCSDVSPDTNTSSGVALGLVNGDAFLDAVFSNSLNQANRVCLGNGLGGFTCSDVSPDTNTSGGVALGLVVGSADSIVYGQLQTLESEPNNECLESNQIGAGIALDGASFMAPCGDFTGQLWKSVPFGNGYSQLQTLLSQEKAECFESNRVVPGNPLNGASHMTPCGNFTGQLWKSVPTSTLGYFHMQSQFSEENDECLESNRFVLGNPLDGASHMAPCGNSTGQLWKFVPQVTQPFDPIFGDGFESGNASAWSTAAP